MGFDGGHRAGYKQVAENVDAVFITSTSGAVTGDWAKLVVMSTEVQLESLTAPGMTGSSLVTSGDTYERGQYFACGQITGVKISDNDSHGLLLAYKRILL
jgi:hypothetical protein